MRIRCSSRNCFWRSTSSTRRWIRYRQHEESCVARSFSTSRNAHHRGRFLKWLSSYLEARRVRNTQLSHIIDSELIQNRETRRRESRQRLVRMLRRR